MSWKFWEKGARKNAVAVDPAKEMVEVEGKQVSLQNLYDAMDEEKGPEAPRFNDDTVLDTPKGEKTLGELKKNFINKMKKNAEPKPCGACGGSGKENAEAGHGEHKEGDKLPDLRHSDQVEEAAKKNDATEEAAKKAEELKQADDKKAAEELEKKNAAEEEKRKEFQNRKEAGRKSFEALRNARHSGGEGVHITPVSIDERLAKGRLKYGSAA